jgi:hypothetical protein
VDSWQIPTGAFSIRISRSVEASFQRCAVSASTSDVACSRAASAWVSATDISCLARTRITMAPMVTTVKVSNR